MLPIPCFTTNKKDNFWEIDVWSHWSCSEIHIDLRKKKKKKSVGANLVIKSSSNRIVEFSFIQYNRNADGSYLYFPKAMILVWD